MKFQHFLFVLLFYYVHSIGVKSCSAGCNNNVAHKYTAVCFIVVCSGAFKMQDAGRPDTGRAECKMQSYSREGRMQRCSGVRMHAARVDTR